MNLKIKARVGRPVTNTTTSSKNGGQVQSLSRGLQLLEEIAQAQTGILLTDLAQRLELPTSTTHRLLNTLESQGFIRREQAQELWFIGPMGFKIGNAFLASRDFAQQAVPFMQTLVAEVGETSNLSILQDGHALIIAQQQCNEMMRMMVPLGSCSPLHASGVGKAILASLPDDEKQAQLDKLELSSITPWTITSKSQLNEALLQTAQQGWAYDDQEHAIGLRCVAACLFDERQYPLAAISVSGPLARIDDDKARALGEKVKESAKLITEFIGGSWPQSS